MVSVSTARKLALALEGVEEKPHFDTASFRYRNKIVMTLDEANQRACLKLSPAEQDIFCLGDKKVIYPVPNKWGLQGWTFVDLSGANHEMVAEILSAAYKGIAQGKKRS